jgi:hypothetical protein
MDVRPRLRGAALARCDRDSDSTFADRCFGVPLMVATSRND